MNDVPYFLETRLRQALANAHELARRKGLVHAFELDLFALEHAVHDLVGPARAAAPASGAPPSAAPTAASAPDAPGRDALGGGGTPEGRQRAQALQARLGDLVGRLQAAPDRGTGDVAVGRAGRLPPGGRRR